VSAVPDTVQTEAVVDTKLTGSPELAVAAKVIGELLNATFARAANEIVCAPWAIEKLCVMGGAAP
jgi:hypothetical protein